MKLLTRYNRVNLLTTIIVMLITGIIYYQAISLILVSQLDKSLVVEENEVFEYVELNHQLPQVFKSNDQLITFTEARPGTVTRQFINTIYRNRAGDDEDHPRRHRRRHEDEFESARGLISSVAVGNKYY